MEMKITFFNDGILFGFTQYSVGDRLEHFEEDWNELNLYLLFIQVQFRWYGR